MSGEGRAVRPLILLSNLSIAPVFASIEYKEPHVSPDAFVARVSVSSLGQKASQPGNGVTRTSFFSLLSKRDMAPIVDFPNGKSVNIFVPVGDATIWVMSSWRKEP